MMKKFLQILLPNTNQEDIVLNEKKKNEKKWENKFQANYEKLIKTKTNNYFLELIETMSIRSIYFEYLNYEDNHSFLKIRKILIMLYR